MRRFRGVFFTGAVLTAYMLCFITAEVSGISMQPTCYESDFLICRRIGKPSFGDIVVVNNDVLGKLLVKRVLGVAGDTISIHNGEIFRNGQLLSEDYIKEDWTGELDLITVPSGNIFVLGDNRNNSVDSRAFGAVPLTEVRGICMLNLTKCCGLSKDAMLSSCFVLWILYFICYFGGSYVKRSRIRRRGGINSTTQG